MKKTEAIVLSVRNWGEADRIVTLFSKEYGKTEAVAYGARKPRSALAASVQLFTQAEMTLAEGKRIDTLKQCHIVRSFRVLREDLTRMAYGSFLTEVCEVLTMDGERDEELYERLLLLLEMIETRNPRIVALAGALQLMKHGGFGPITERCSACGCAVEGEVFFDRQLGGIVCEACRQTNSILMRESMRSFIAWLETLGDGPVEPPRVTGRDMVDTEKLLLSYLTDIIDRPLRSLTFIAQLGDT